MFVVNDLKYNIDKHVKPLYQMLHGEPYEKSHEKRLTVVGRRLIQLINGNFEESTIERVQGNMVNLQNTSLSDVIAGKTILDEKQVEKLTTAPSEIALAVQKIMETLYPRPIERIFNTTAWKESVFRNLARNDYDVVSGMTLFRYGNQNNKIYFLILLF